MRTHGTVFDGTYRVNYMNKIVQLYLGPAQLLAEPDRNEAEQTQIVEREETPSKAKTPKSTGDIAIPDNISEKENPPSQEPIKMETLPDGSISLTININIRR